MRVAVKMLAAGVAALLPVGPGFADSSAREYPAIQLTWSTPDLTREFDLSGQQDAINTGEARDDSAIVPFPSLGPAWLSPAYSEGEFANPDLSGVLGNDTFLGTTIALAGDLHIRASEEVDRPSEPAPAVLSDLDQLQLARSAESGSRTLLAGADWNFASWGGLGLVAAASNQSGADLGVPIRLQFPGSKFSTMIGVTGHLSFGDGWVTSFSYDEGRTQLDLRPNALTVQGRGFGVEVSKKGLFDNDTLGIALVRPADSTLDLASNGNDSRLLGSQISLSSATPETDVELGYETFFNGNITLQADAAYQMNVGGQNGTKGVSVLSRAKINF